MRTIEQLSDTAHSVLNHTNQEENIMHINSITDAKNYVLNSGVADWDWSHDTYTNDEIVNDLLPQYLRANYCNDHAADTDQEFNRVLAQFIDVELQQNPADYGITVGA